MNRRYVVLVLLGLGVLFPAASDARIKLAALPQRVEAIIRLDNPDYTLIEEERVLTLQKGLNKVDFAWNGVSIDPDSIRLHILTHPSKVRLLNVSYPPNENALVWEISSAEAEQERVRVSYLLSNIDRLITYKALADKEETKMELKSYLVLRNFSGEDFAKAQVFLDDAQPFERGINHEETQQWLFLGQDQVPFQKIWRWDSLQQVWDPEKVQENVGIPVSYKIKNESASGLGKNTLSAGKVRVYQQDGQGSTILLGEDTAAPVSVGEDMDAYVGDSRDIVVTQRKMVDQTINVRRNTNNSIVLYDKEQQINAQIENFKDTPALLTLVQHMPQEWEMKDCNLKYTRKDAHTLEFEIALAPRSKQELNMHYYQRNIR
ncbi:MAG: hypothetical protein A2Z81_02450 [Omnitrophica WOR_2 bacterium GWA2_45_18]|nr:MAG: hypothetical protein A2Z81_02450 [Omnitrophica WOR_2 bacterium GWA2_45_18]